MPGTYDGRKKKRKKKKFITFAELRKEKETKIITLAELQEHNMGKSVWIAIHGQVYDVTKFLEEVMCTSVLHVLYIILRRS